MGSKIEWTDITWNPIVGCTKVSEGCANCYAEELNKRFKWLDDWRKLKFYPDRLDKITPRQKPCKIFVCSMSDLFHERVESGWLDQIHDKIRECKQHTFMVLTKRPKRMASYYNCIDEVFPNLWLGVTCENQRTANERIPILLQTPAAVRFISVEPMLSEIIIPDKTLSRLSWTIVGCESGQKARECKSEWVESLINQCENTGVPVFLKQLMQNGKLVKEPYFNGKQYLQYPERR